MAILYEQHVLLLISFSVEIMIVSLCFSLLDVTLIIRYMLWGMCPMLAERQIVVPLLKNRN
jgi:hypothetical protein